MKKFLKIISAILIFSFLLSGCKSGTADIMTGSLSESETLTASVTEATEIQMSTASSETETVTETTTETTTEAPTETSETAAGTGGATAEGFVISPSGYVLDPQNVIPDGTNFWTEEGSGEVRRSGLAYLLTELPDGETRIYGICPDEEPSEIIIEHDGIADEFEEFWSTRYGDIAYNDTASCKFWDMDGDGENEVVLKKYAEGGTIHCVFYLSVYKMENGHYKRYELDHEKLAREYIKTDIDNDAKTITVSVKNSDKDFVYDLSESCPYGAERVWYTTLVVYGFEENGVKMSYYGLIKPDPESGLFMPIDDYIRVEFSVSFKDGEFVLSDPVITATDDFDTYND